VACTAVGSVRGRLQKAGFSVVLKGGLHSKVSHAAPAGVSFSDHQSSDVQSTIISNNLVGDTQ
jgi:hypothetical protein